jgi:hypothetical protein
MPVYKSDTLDQLAKCQKLLQICMTELKKAMGLMARDKATIVDAEQFAISMTEYTIMCSFWTFKRLLETKPPTPPSEVSPPTIQVPLDAQDQA